MSTSRSVVQTRMFGVSDLPLFSGTPVRGSNAVFTPQPAPARQATLGRCPVCFDTGFVGTTRCTCGAGLPAEADTESAPDENSDDGFVPPSYWGDLVLYTTPGVCRPAIALVGPAGNGKTTAAEAVCRHHGYDAVVIDANEYLEPADLVGALTFDPQQGEIWRDGPVTRAFREGHAVIINEFDALNPRAALCLQSALQDAGSNGQSRYVTTPGATEHDRVYPASDCPIVLTMNTYGSGATRQYVGRNTLDAASLDRITLISTGYENEADILVRGGVSRFTATRLAAWVEVMRERIEANALRVILSIRTLKRMAQAIDHYGWTLEQAIQKEFLSRLDTDVRELLEDPNHVQ